LLQGIHIETQRHIKQTAMWSHKPTFIFFKE
jgi:hypothetical protein